MRFSNGMSANERAGCLSCWTRLAFDKHDPECDPNVSIVTVCNNRADRVPRSRVFARIMVRDIDTHRSLLINSNLGGLRQFVEEELNQYLADTRIADSSETFGAENAQGNMLALERFDELMVRVKISPGSEGALRTAIEPSVDVLGLSDADKGKLYADLDFSVDTMDPRKVATRMRAIEAGQCKEEVDDALREDVAFHTERICKQRRMAWDARKVVAHAKTADEANQALRTVYRTLFLDNLHIIWDVNATGDQVIDQVTSSVPPGHRVRLMGIQNIKGTGLDFVYRWLSVDAVRQALQKLQKDPASRGDTLAWLASYAGYGLLDCRDALQELRRVAAEQATDFESHRTLLDATIARLDSLEKKLADRLRSTGGPNVYEKVFGKAEKWIDSFDSMARHYRAGRIMKELKAARLGHVRAAELMRDITKRDKGGWLAKWVMAKMKG